MLEVAVYHIVFCNQFHGAIRVFCLQTYFLPGSSLKHRHLGAHVEFGAVRQVVCVQTLQILNKTASIVSAENSRPVSDETEILARKSLNW